METCTCKPVVVEGTSLVVVVAVTCKPEEVETCTYKQVVVVVETCKLAEVETCTCKQVVVVEVGISWVVVEEKSKYIYQQQWFPKGSWRETQ